MSIGHGRESPSDIVAKAQKPYRYVRIVGLTIVATFTIVMLTLRYF